MFYPVIVCTFAGLSTALGGLAVIAKGGISQKGLSVSQGFAAGVMLAVSILDLLPESYGVYYSYMPVLIAFKSVAVLFVLGCIIGTLVSSVVMPYTAVSETDKISSVRRIALITFAVMVVHNLPEGMLTIFTSSADFSMGIEMAVAVALHNIPEGMAIASPVLYTSGSRLKAFMWSLMAGMAEPIGGILAFTLLKNTVTPAFLNGFMPMVAGIMCQAAVCELVPTAIKLSNIKHTFCGIITGITAMAIGLFLF
ncbi:MAG: ZIP family metal transporter [Oscillospiraceae bacterium]|nr:ZIP family metal transporter [Oscillospiraceae bacterium]